jgi:hypothetical protein
MWRELLQKAKESNTDGIDMVLESGGKDVGIYSLTAATIGDFAKHSEARAATLQQLLAPLAGRPSLTRISVAEDMWQRVDTKKTFSRFCAGPGFGGRNFCCIRGSQHRDAWIHTSSALEDPPTPRLSFEDAFRRTQYDAAASRQV